ncbi:MAG: DNA-deoxyinosine glycosylase [Alphaproteobacteria bacterium]|nr:DNA-deoxyinosine glycosylase [Alphaproteobacteria bacterium]
MYRKAKSFPPVSTLRSRVLVLGSMPGIRSLEMRQYYAHPQNAFWKIMGALFGMPVNTYPQRLALIKKKRLALWDVMQYCERQGSLDHRIASHTIEVNDFALFLRSRREITRIYFNGAKAEQEFKRRVLPKLPPDVATRLSCKRLPSTSPTHASLRPDAKLKAWSVIIDDMEEDGL